MGWEKEGEKGGDGREEGGGRGSASVNDDTASSGPSVIA